MKNLFTYVVLTFFLLTPQHLSGEEGRNAAASAATNDTTAILETKFGVIELEFFPDSAPNHVRNFLKLAESGFYDGTTFHRVVPRLLAQGGDPYSRYADRSMHGYGGPGYTLKAEFNKRHHGRGILSMARGGTPDSAGSQFFICLADAKSLDGKFTVFGEVLSGMDVVDEIARQKLDNKGNPLQRVEMDAEVFPIQGTNPDLRKAHLLMKDLQKLLHARRYRDALPLGEETRMLRERALGTDHPYVAKMHTTLARLYLELGDHGKAAPHITQSVRIYEITVGLNHSKARRSLDLTMENLERLANQFWNEGKYPASLDIRKAKLDLTTRIYGAEHWKTRESAWVLADAERRSTMPPDDRKRLDQTAAHLRQAEAAQSESKYEEALDSAQKALGIYRDLLGDKSIPYAQTLHRIALIKSAQSQDTNAAALFLEAAEIFKREYGGEDPSYATLLDYAGQSYFHLKDYSRAETLYLQALDIRTRAFGEEKVSVAHSAYNLGILYLRWDDNVKAAAFLQKAATAYRVLQGSKSKYALNAVDRLDEANMALYETAMKREDFQEALRLQRHIVSNGKLVGRSPVYINNAQARADDLAMLIKLSGEKQRQILLADRLETDASRLRREGKGREALATISKSLALTKDVLGEKNRKYAQRINDMADTYALLDENDLAEKTYRHALDILQGLPSIHQSLEFTISRNLAGLYITRHELDKAENLLMKNAAETKPFFGKDISRFYYPKELANTLAWLADSFTKAKLYSSARRAREEELELKTLIYGQADPRTKDARLNLDLARRYERLTPQQQRNLSEAEKLVDHAKVLRGQKKYTETLSALRRAEKIQGDLLGKDNWIYFNTQSEMIVTFSLAGDRQQAVAMAQERLRRMEQTGGTEHARYGIALVELAILYSSAGDYEQAISHFKTASALYKNLQGEKDADYLNATRLMMEELDLDGAKAIRSEDWDHARKAFREIAEEGRKTFGPTYWMVREAEMNLAYVERLSRLPQADRRRLDSARSLYEQAERWKAEGRLHDALSPLREALQIHETVLGTDTVAYANLLSKGLSFFSAAEDFGSMEQAADRLLALQEKMNMGAHPRTIAALYAKSTLLFKRDLFKEGADLDDKASAMLEEIARTSKLKETEEYVSILRDRAANYERTNRQEKVVSIYREMLIITRGQYGLYSSQAAEILLKLGRAYYDTGQYAFARQYLQEVLQIQETVLGKNHRSVASTLNVLGLLHLALSDYDHARDYFQRAIAVLKQVEGDATSSYATFLGNLAVAYSSSGNLDTAEKFFIQTLNIQEKLSAGDSARTALTKANLGDLYLEKGDLDKADAFLNQALTAQSRKTGAYDQLAMASTLTSRARLLQARGNLSQAADDCRKAADIRKKIKGEEHPSYVYSLSQLAYLYLAQGDDRGAEQILRETLRLNYKNIEEAAAALSERQQITITRTFQNNLFAYLSVAERLNLPARDSYQHLLAWKGIVFTRQVWMKTMRDQPEFRQFSEELQDVTNRLSTLTLTVAEKDRDEAMERLIRQLTERKEQLEGEFSRASAKFRDIKVETRKTPEDIQSALPGKTALVDFIEYWRLSPGGDKKGTVKEEHRLAAFVVQRDRSTVFVDLGPVKPIENAVERWRRIYSKTADGKRRDDPGASLRTLIWEPLSSHLGTIERLLVSPDGTLTRIPLSALPGKKPASFLLEDIAIAVIPVPQLMPGLAKEKKRPLLSVPPSLMLVGDVDFDSAPGTIRSGKKDDPALYHARDHRAPSIHFSSLPGTTKEIRLIRDIYEKAYGSDAALTVTTLRGRNATERALRKNARGQTYIHLATHGFFAPEGLLSATSNPSDYQRSIKVIAKAKPTGEEGGEEATGMHPGLLSGIALVGANHSSQATSDGGQLADDGILTALEVAELDLANTDLVVLSACETGLGKLAGGEGVFGLQRAFQVSGARTVVASLWTVDDAATQTLMVEFYRNLWEKKMGKLEALRRAQLSMLQSASHPYYWAAFVLSGDWR